MSQTKTNSINDILHDNQYFFFPMYIFMFIGFLIVFQNPKGEMLHWINSHHSDLLDSINLFLSWLGKGYLLIFAVLILAAYKLRYGILGISTFAISGILAQILKRVFDFPRPKGFYGDLDPFYLIEGFKHYSQHSFPSGHTVTMFAMMAFFALITKQKWTGLVFFLIAYFAAFSRLYLLQHFFVDVYAGAILGTLVAFALWLYCEKNSKINNWKFIDYSFLNDKILGKKEQAAN